MVSTLFRPFQTRTRPTTLLWTKEESQESRENLNNVVHER